MIISQAERFDQTKLSSGAYIGIEPFIRLKEVNQGENQSFSWHSAPS
jgi:hypothetical protein